MNEAVKLLLAAIAEARGESQVDILEPLGPLSDELEEQGLDRAARRIRAQGTWMVRRYQTDWDRDKGAQWREVVVNGEHCGIVYLPPRGRKWRAITTDGKCVARLADWQMASLHCIIGSP